MPPKKKKPTVSPIVVGTVSTRSTRRQSVVNIDIPKSSRSSIKKNPTTEVSKEISTSDDFSEKIKQTYNKMFSKIFEASTKMLNPSLTSNDNSSDSKSDSSMQMDTKLKSNEALLQILEDWTDDESQDDKQESLPAENDNELEESQERNADEGTISDLVSMIQKQSMTEEVVSEHPTELSNQYESHVEKHNYAQKEMDKIKREIVSKTEQGSDTQVLQYILESNEPVPIEEHVEEIVAFEEENVVECVTEEVVFDDNGQFVLMDTAEDNVTTGFEINQEENTPPEEINKSELIVAALPHVETPVEVTNENKEVVIANFIVEETSQSVSTTDSNDAEVRSFFTKEIENNKTVTEEDILTLEFKAQNREDTESANSMSEGSVKITDVTNTRNSAANSEEYVVESEKDSTSAEGNNDCELNKSVTPSEKLFMEECKTEDVIEVEETIMDKEAAEPMDTTDDTNEETIESKVAQMHLVDELEKEEDTSRESSKLYSESISFNYTLKEDIEEVIGVKTSSIYSKDLMKVEYDEENKLADNLDLSVEKPKTRRTRNEIKVTTKELEEQLDVKSSKASKSKEKKPPKPRDKTKESKSAKEVKNKKKSSVSLPVRKPKDKSEKRDTGKNDKKDIKKITKNDNDQLKKNYRVDNIDFEDIEVRRSSRIKSISVLKKKTTGHGLVRSKSEPVLNESDVSDSNSTHTESEKSTPSASPKVSMKDKKGSRWTRSSENLLCESQSITDTLVSKNDGQMSEVTGMEVDEKPKLPIKDPVVTARLKQFVHLKENMYKTDRMTCKEAKKMTCDCFLTSEEIDANEYGCGEDCLNRLLLIECGNLCQVGDRCTNKRFQKGQFAPVEVFNTEKKGLGLRAAANIPFGEFILEYVGEVLNCEEFDKRAEVYSQDKNIHYYFMSLRADAIIDATMKGNISRFINHSCDPNAETQKWTVNGELRIGFFSTRTILAGEEITFDYRFQRYGKEAQRCYCEAAICRGWLGEQPDEDSEDEDEEEEEEEEEVEERAAVIKTEVAVPEIILTKEEEVESKVAETTEEGTAIEVKEEKTEVEVPTVPVTPKRKSPRKKPRKDLFEELDQLDEEIEMLLTTGLKNQAHTLKLSRLMVRAKEPPQRTKLLRILRRGELPCRRLFLDYHGLRLMHGYMIDAQHLVHSDKKYESLRLEMLQTLAVLPIPNKSMLQDSKVLPTVEKWAADKDLGSPQDSDSNSPNNDHEVSQPPKDEATKDKESAKKTPEPKKEDVKLERSIEDQEEEIRFLASKLLEGWTNLKEVFRIPKKERIEQMKEHEREANKKFMQGGYGNEPDSGRKSDRYRHLSRYKMERDTNRKGAKCEEKPSAEFIRLSKIERRKLFALQHELKEEERRLKQREMWRQHEVNCMMIGTDPRFTAPFDPSRGYQCIWNPQIGQWQNYPLPAQNQMIFSPQAPSAAVGLGSLPNLSMPPPQLQAAKAVPGFPYPQQIPIATSLNGGVTQLPTGLGLTGQMQLPQPQMHLQATSQSAISQLHLQQQVGSMQGIPGTLPQNIPTHPQIPASIPAQPPLPQYQEQVKKEDDSSQVKFMGPIPPPAKLPPKWKCAKDKYGRPYYYHVKMRKSQWEPPPFLEPMEDPEESSESESSSDTSSISSDTSTENSDSDDDIDDTRLLMEVRKQMEKSAKLTLKSVIPDHVKMDQTPTPSPDDRNSDQEGENDEETPNSFLEDDVDRPSIDMRLKEQFNLKDDNPPKKKRRIGLCEEIMISPRSEEDRLQFKEDLKRYKANKEKLKRQKEIIMQQTKKQMRELDSKRAREKRPRASLKTRIKEMPDFNSEQAKKIKESFRSNMASTVVGSLNAYRKPDCKEGRITNTEDFKHLARKLTHFVMLKEMKHIEKIEDLTCTDNVKSKAREYIKKYMSKFGEVYVKRNDSPDFKD